MARRFGWSLLGALVVSTPLLGNAPNLPPLKYVDPVVRFDGIDKFPDHVFFLRFLTFTGSSVGVPHKVIPVRNEKPFPLGAKERLTEMSMISVERKSYQKRSKDDPSLGWLTEMGDGVDRDRFLPPKSMTPWGRPTLTIYQVTMNEGRLQVSDPKVEANHYFSAGLIPGWTFGLALAVSLAWVGIWAARRTQRPGENVST